ncbi:putative methanogenesis marker protein 1 [Methanomethylovorans hollandica DSM 15978]|uniref:Putative methanogenesis marker protein 1 n=1 Tax=Methanomethylovorans hollandica (strain DSM 15978 / NBRC 107637 / DMS1) TaxID=867904 RepID=L0KZ17_METHD|nr:YcaO-related McrA-glycine thioamidation protein [Methanomethylovorans hollandica]AGB50336.1 putative methanogenesis marker protein 1 [Methanomethylovorans hollandica DSM 15978]
MPEIIIDESLTYIEGTQRVFTEEETLQRVQPLLKDIGVTRIANITDLDKIGIPVFSSIRPSAAEGAISVYSGKGANEVQARISAIMESFERCLAERSGVNKDVQESIASKEFIETPEIAGSSYTLIEPRSLLLSEKPASSSRVEWTTGWDLLKKEEVLLPSNAVYHPYDPPGLSLKLFRTNTNGLAAGNTIEEAIFHGLLEVLERDALSIAEFNRFPGKEIVLSEDDGENYRLAQMCKENGIDIKLWLLFHDTDVPTVVAALDDVQLKDPALLVMGAGSHLDPSIAVRRAITEAAQSRVVQIHGAREDTEREKFVRDIGYERIKRMNSYWYEEGEKVKLADIKDLSNDRPSANIDLLLQKIGNVAQRAVVVDLSRKSIGVPVVRVTVPTFEVYTIDHERMGSRIKKAPRRKLSADERPWKRRMHH